MTAEAPQVKRQWVALPGSSCDIRVGAGAIQVMSKVMRVSSSAGSRRCAFVCEEGAPEEVAAEITRQLTDAGFVVSRSGMPAGPKARTLATVEALCDTLGSAKITADDMVCVLGGLDALSAASFVTSSWCGGTQLEQVPTDLAACVEASNSPRGIDVAGSSEMLATRPAAKYMFCDADVIDLDPQLASSLYARAVMATSALIESEAAVERLWDRAELLAEGDPVTVCEQLADTVKSRGKVISSTSIAVRQSLTFGTTFLRGMRDLIAPEVPDGLIIAEGVRFQSRIACGLEFLKVDDVLTSDELLDLLALDPITCDVDPQAMVDALKAACFARSSRFLLELPRATGRVRSSAVEDELLLEHATAWCASRRPA